jgi:hypothetical protein
MPVENEELDEQTLFDATVSDEPEATVADVAEVPEKPEADQPRDEAGKFAKADEPEKPILEADKPAADDNAAQVPSWRVREINDEKRALADKVASLEAERLNWQRPEPPKVEKAAKPDPLLDPEGYEAYIEQKLEDKLLNNHRESSLQSAHKTYKGEFEEAYASAQKNIDPALKARMQLSRDPGETLIQWHREQKTRAEVGTDLNAYKQRLRDEALKDPEFRKAAMEAWRSEPQQNNGRPRVELPPTMSRVSRSNAALRASSDDLDDQALFQETTG